VSRSAVELVLRDGRSATSSGTISTILAAASLLAAAGETAPRLARDPINQPMINNWVEAMGDANPRYLAGEAPPAMAQVWTMGGLNPQRDPNDPLHSMMGVLTEAGYTGVLGTNCEQSYDRYLRVGEQVSVTTRLESVVGPKQTGMGEGYFVTTVSTWRVANPDGRSEQVATMLFRVLKFMPKVSTSSTGAGDEVSTDEVSTGSTGAGDEVSTDEVSTSSTGDGTGSKPEEFVLRPTVNRDTAYFWEGTAVGELRIHQCGACGALRHPPGPACPECHAFDRTHVVASGRGTLFSYVVHRHPPIPGFQLPIVIGLVDLEEGPRFVATLEGIEEPEIGMPLEIGFRRIDDELVLPVWKAVE